MSHAAIVGTLKTLYKSQVFMLAPKNQQTNHPDHLFTSDVRCHIKEESDAGIEVPECNAATTLTVVLH